MGWEFDKTLDWKEEELLHALHVPLSHEWIYKRMCFRPKPLQNCREERRRSVGRSAQDESSAAIVHTMAHMFAFTSEPLVLQQARKAIRMSWLV